MRLGISLQVAGSEDKKSTPIQRPITTTMYLGFVNNLRVNEQIKEKFRALVAKMPSPALRTVINNIHEYTKRFEAEVHRESIGALSVVSNNLADDNVKEEKQLFAVPDFDPVALAAKMEKYKLTEGKYDTSIEEEVRGSEIKEEIDCEEEIQIKWVNACESEYQSGPTDQLQREDHQLHTNLPDGTICHGGLTGELYAGWEQSKDSAAVSGERDDRLWTDVDGTERIQGSGDAG